MVLVCLFVALLQLYLTGTVSHQLDLNSGWSVKVYRRGDVPRSLLFFETMIPAQYKHPESDGPDWIETQSKLIFWRARIRTGLDGMGGDISDFIYALEVFGASGAEKDAAIRRYVDYLKLHRVRVSPEWDFDARRIWIEGLDGAVIQLWPHVE
jgi:hypothetical protein